MSIENNKNYYKNQMSLPEGDFGNVTNTLFKFYGLEKLYRKGFKLNKIADANCQTVAEHTAAVINLAILTILEYNMEIDINKVIQILAVHEYGETVIGDITPFDGISKEEKYEAEKEAFKEIVKDLNNGEYLYNLWDEFEKKETKESQFAYDMDKLEAALNAIRYEKSLGITGKTKSSLDRFYPFTLKQLYFNESKEILTRAWSEVI